MTETLFEYGESAVAIGNILITFCVSILVSLTIGYLMGAVKKSLKLQILSSVLFQIIVTMLYLAVRDGIHDYRKGVITSGMTQIQKQYGPCVNKAVPIDHWKTGLEQIILCPSEVGYYIKTADLLAADRDFESATTLIEFGLDFIEQEPIPEPLCQRLRMYYEHVRNRPNLDSSCNKFHTIW